MNTLKQIRFIWKPIIFLLCLVPALFVVKDVLVATGILDIAGGLGANPIEDIQDRFGNWALRFIMIALAVTPLRRLSGWNWLSRFRRMFGLFTFFYAMLHFLVWLVLDQEIRLSAILEDITERPFITIGFVALVFLTALAITSFTALRRRMGRRWQSLHNLAYVVGMLGVWHYWWQVKKDITEPLVYAVILGVLLGARLIWRWQRQHKKSPA